MGLGYSCDRLRSAIESVAIEFVGHQGPEVSPGFPGSLRLHPGQPRLLPQFFHWYNQEHRHSGIGLLTPAMVHFGEAQTVLARRQVVLDAAYQAHPDRFVRLPPKPLPLPEAVWINRPLPNEETKEEGQ